MMGAFILTLYVMSFILIACTTLAFLALGIALVCERENNDHPYICQECGKKATTEWISFENSFYTCNKHPKNGAHISRKL